MLVIFWLYGDGINDINEITNYGIYEFSVSIVDDAGNSSDPSSEVLKYNYTVAADSEDISSARPALSVVSVDDDAFVYSISSDNSHNVLALGDEINYQDNYAIDGNDLFVSGALSLIEPIYNPVIEL